MRTSEIQPRFVEFIPDLLEEGVLYISERYRTCSHKCCCGCGEEVVTPLSPSEWKLTREGNLVSLWPSVGNWDYACRSHYVIRRNRIRWAGIMTTKQVAAVQKRDTTDLARMVAQLNAAKEAERVPTLDRAYQTHVSQSYSGSEPHSPLSWWWRLLNWLLRKQ